MIYQRLFFIKFATMPRLSTRKISAWTPHTGSPPTGKP
jgi:hypothetical protein